MSSPGLCAMRHTGKRLAPEPDPHIAAVVGGEQEANGEQAAAMPAQAKRGKRKRAAGRAVVHTLAGDP